MEQGWRTGGPIRSLGPILASTGFSVEKVDPAVIWSVVTGGSALPAGPARVRPELDIDVARVGWCRYRVDLWKHYQPMGCGDWLRDIMLDSATARTVRGARRKARRMLLAALPDR